MNILVYLTMYFWIPFVILCFLNRKSEDACLIAFISAWLFLPEANFPLIGLPDYNKMSATCYGIFFCAWLFDRSRITQFKFQWFDIPMIVFCLSPFLSSLSNGLGPYDGFSCSLGQIVAWGFPYLIGRVYFNTVDAHNKLISAIIIGGLIYVPLCLIEIQLSPQLHNWIYGYHVASFQQSIRYGGYRPSVFMEHGLMVGMWMATATLSAYWLIFSSKPPFWVKYRKHLILISLTVTLVLVKSTGAIILTLVGISLLILSIKFSTRLVTIMLISLPILYIATRATGEWDGQSLIQQAEMLTNRDRAQSLAFRIENEELIAYKARTRPIFGWGDWGRWRVYDDNGDDITISDSLWVIIFGRNGYVGVFSLYGFLLLPVILLIYRTPSNEWLNQPHVGVSLFSILCLLYAIDCLFNAMVNPFFALISGASLSLVLQNIPINNNETYLLTKET